MPKSSGAPIGRPWQALALSCVLTLLVTTLTFAQSGGAPSLDPAVDSPPASVVTRDATGKVVVHATRITQPPDIDGRLDDAVYREVPAITEFIQQEPTEGAPITEKTEAWVTVRRREHLHRVPLLGRASRADRRQRHAARQQQPDAARPVCVTFDTFHDRRNGFLFGVTADRRASRTAPITDERPNFDWNGVWDAKATTIRAGLDRGDGASRSSRCATRPGGSRPGASRSAGSSAAKNERAHHHADVASLGHHRP